jgi:hypothetical protein
MLSTVPQILQVWVGSASGVSLVSWASYLVAACLWLIHGVRKHDKSIYLACTGGITLDAAIVIGIIVRDRAADPPGFRVPAHVISPSEAFLSHSIPPYAGMVKS